MISNNSFLCHEGKGNGYQLPQNLIKRTRNTKQYLNLHQALVLKTTLSSISFDSRNNLFENQETEEEIEDTLEKLVFGKHE
ncbi:hypothetical protein NUSPORA_02379 [Nucleospora cyclopteri]